LIGAGYGEGAQKGVEVLKNTGLPEGLLAAVQAEEQITASVQKGAEAFEEPNLAEKAGQAISDWWSWATTNGAVEESAKTGAGQYAQGITNDASVNDAIAGKFKEGAEAGSTEAVGVISSRATDIGDSLTGGITESLSNGSSEIADAVNAEVERARLAFSGLAQSIDTAALATAMNSAVVKPAETAKNILDGIDASGLAGNFTTMGQAASNIRNANLGQVMSQVSNASSTAARNTNSMANSTKSAVSSARSYANELERAARAASSAASNRWSGGPVSGGQAYTVNELGKEMFMAKSGALSEIKAPAFGKWVAPSSGTVIPAGVAQQIRNQRDAVASNASAAALKGTPSLALSNMAEGPSLTSAISRGFKGIGPMGTNQVVNNVNVTSDRPVNDASKILTDLAKIRAQRRR